MTIEQYQKAYQINWALRDLKDKLMKLPNKVDDIKNAQLYDIRIETGLTYHIINLRGTKVRRLVKESRLTLERDIKKLEEELAAL